MPSGTAKPSSILALDITPLEIHAHLIKRPADVYRWMGVGRAQTTLTMLGNVDKRSLVKSLRQLSARTGYLLLDDDGRLVYPSDNKGRGVDCVSLTWSLPVPLKVVLIGLIPAYSLNIGQRLIAEMQMTIIDQISLTDGRSDEEKLDTILSGRPDLIILLGGVDGGAEKVIKNQVDLIVRSLKIIPQDLRPEVVYLGNAQLAEYVKTAIEAFTVISTAPNIQPTLVETDLQPARETLARVCSRIWLKHYHLQIGTQPLSVDSYRPTRNSIEDFTNILAECENAVGGCVSIYMDGTSSIISTSRDGRSTSYQYGMVNKTEEIFRQKDEIKLIDVTAWAPAITQQSVLSDHIMGDAFYPGRLPVTNEDSILEYGIDRAAGRRAWHLLTLKKDFPRRLISKQAGVDTDVLFIGGSRLHTRNSYGRLLLDVLDILQPIGITDVRLDREGLAASLGMLAHLDPIIPIHCILGNAIPKLATVIAPAFHARDDVKIMSLIITDKNGKEVVQEVRSGNLLRVPLTVGETAMVQIKPHLGVNLGSRKDWKKGTSVSGSMLGIVIDARGRPLSPRKDPQAQQAWMMHCIEQAREMDK